MTPMTLRDRDPDLDRTLETLPTLGSLVAALVTPALLEAADRALLADPGFARLYHDRRTFTPEEGAEADAPPGSLGDLYIRFLAHYRLPRRFFPAAPAAPRPVAYAARRLAEIHDLIHVIGEYETSDGDEAAIQSFVAGQAPVAFAVFLRDALSTPDAEAAAYVHLRQIPAQPIQRGDLARGREAAPLLTVDFERAWATPVVELRQRLGVRARCAAPDPEHTNTCGGAPVGPFFAASR